MNCIKLKECQNAIYPHKCKSCGSGMVNFIKVMTYEVVKQNINNSNLSSEKKTILLGYVDYCKEHNILPDSINNYMKDVIYTSNII
jgi:hypothetical protein